MLVKIRFLVAACLPVCLLAITPVDRNCCRYRCPADNPGECAPWCHNNPNTCVIKNNSDTALVLDSGCSVMYDTKVDQHSVKSKEDCLKKNFNARKSFDELPFFLDPYVFQTSNLSHLPYIGLDLKFRYNMFQKLRFRFKNMNQNVCPENLSLDERSPCNPRCVEIDKRLSKPTYGLQQNMNLLSYDCEVGFYKVENKYIMSSKDEYRLSICADQDGVDKCGEFAFQMPTLKDLEEGRVLVLLDRQEFERRDKIVVHVPTHQNPDAFVVSVLLLGENNTQSSIFNQEVPVTHGAHNPMRIEIDHNIPSGRYQIAIIPLRGGNRTALPSYSAHLERPDYGQHALLIITIILTIIIVVGVMLAGYKRRQRIIEESTIEPNILVKTGALETKSIFVITQLDNTEHAQIVRELCGYLRTHCGIADTFYPLDEEGGVLAAGNGSGDPWKWAQKSYEKVKESGSVVCIAGPGSHHTQGSSVWPGIQESQMFLVEPDLINLYRQGRIVVVTLPYSDPATLPSALPANMVQEARQIPRDLNSVLLQIHQMERQGCSCIGWGCVRPRVLPANLASRSAGLSLLDRINRLSNKIQLIDGDKTTNSVHSNSIIHRILKREVKRSRRRSSPAVTSSTTLVSKSTTPSKILSAAGHPAETDRLLAADTNTALTTTKKPLVVGQMVTDLKGDESIETSLKRYVEKKQSAGGGCGDFDRQDSGAVVSTTSNDDDEDGGDMSSPLPQDSGGGSETTTNNRTIHIDLEQNLLSIKSLMHRDKTSVDDV